MRASPVLFVLVCLAVLRSIPGAEEERFGLERRVPWITSRVIGSPEPPLPFTTERFYTNLAVRNPMFLAPEPGAESLLLVLQGGEKERPSRVLRVRDEASADETEAFLVMTNRLIYSVEFHPGYRTNGWLFVFSNGPTPEQERTNRISRFTVDRMPPYHCDSASEVTILEWHSQGHDGGGIVFGNDGMLYISTGDGTSDSDGWNSGQTLDDLLGSVLRIDVEHPQGTKSYSVPLDNPFVKTFGARPEIWAYGLRNPWRMTIDRKRGHLWVGINGQDLWETAQLVRRGENYGWSVYEGSHPFYLNRKRGPTPIVAPTIEHPHSEMRSLTGGIVYDGDEFPELEGAYIYGDHSTGQIWGAKHDGTTVTWHKKLAQTTHQIAAFCQDARGRVLIVDYGGGIYRLARAPKEDHLAEFPRKLSETGIFLSTRENQIAPGIIPFSVNAPGWADGAEAERFVGLPNDTRIGRTRSGGWNFTNGAVVLQTLSLEKRPGDPTTRRRIESRILTYQSGQWAGYSYRWNEEQSDATLVPASGDEIRLSSDRVWRFPSRDECMGCHSRAANFVLGLSDVQMDRTHDYGGVDANQIRTFEHIGLFKETQEKGRRRSGKLVNPYETNESPEIRARSYLHVNCSVCHVEAGGGNSKMELAVATPLDRMNLIEARPQHDTFAIANAMLVAPGHPENSVLFQRISRRGQGQMPPVATKTVDQQAVALFREWISGMNSKQQFVKDWQMDDFLPFLGQIAEGRSRESGKNVFQQAGCAQCHRFAGNGGTVGPDLEGVGKRLTAAQVLESILLPSKVIAEGYASHEIETTDGESFTGSIEREDGEAIVLRPLSALQTAVTIPKKQIARRTLSNLSNMPAGIANSLSQEQILDLVAYLSSSGK